MQKRMEPNGKRRNEMRWEQGRLLVEKICPTLPTSSHVAVLMYCWFRARGRECVFSESNDQIAQACKLKKRHVINLVKEMEAGGVIKTIERAVGRGRVCRRSITGSTYRHAEKKVHPDAPLPK